MAPMAAGRRCLLLVLLCFVFLDGTQASYHGVAGPVDEDMLLLSLKYRQQVDTEIEMPATFPASFDRPDCCATFAPATALSNVNLLLPPTDPLASTILRC
jgi:hypothetical protein